MDKMKTARSCLLLLLILRSQKKATSLSLNWSPCCVSVCNILCARLCVRLQLGSIECQSLLWLSLTDSNNGCIHFGLGSRLQAPGRWETVNKPQLAASRGVTQQPGCLFYFFPGKHGVRIAATEGVWEKTNHE